MFGNLVESSSHKSDYARRGSFFLGTLTAYALVFMAIGVGSIYAYNTHIEKENLELVSLVIPVETPQAETPQRREAPRAAATASSHNPPAAIVKTTPVMTTMDPLHVPNKASVSSDVPELPLGTKFKIGTPGPNKNIFGGSGDKTTGGHPGGDQDGLGSKELAELATTPPPPLIKKEVVKPPAKTISLGVVNGQASALPKPVYTAIAKAAHASGVVTVQVLIDEFGKVVSARAVSGHPLLLKESVQAAYQARFTPTKLSNQPVKVSGVITYNFVMQ
jgi:TonB family protein